MDELVFIMHRFDYMRKSLMNDFEMEFAEIRNSERVEEGSNGDCDFEVVEGRIGRVEAVIMDKVKVIESGVLDVDLGVLGYIFVGLEDITLGWVVEVEVVADWELAVDVLMVHQVIQRHYCSYFRLSVHFTLFEQTP